MVEKEKLEKYGVSIGVNYIKRWMESNVYDKAFATELGEHVKSLDKKTRYGIEAALNVLSAFFEEKLKGDGALRSIIHGVGSDVAPEISKRLLNHAETPEQKQAAEVLLSLGNQQLQTLLEWLYAVPEQRRKQIFDRLTLLSSEDLSRMVLLPAEDRDQLMEMISPQKQSEWALRDEAAADFLYSLRSRIEKSREKRRQKHRGSKSED